MNFNKLNRKVVFAWRLGRSIGSFIILLILAIPTILLYNESFFQTVASFVFAAEGVILALLILSVIILPEISYKQCGYVISNDRVGIKHGIFFINTVVVPIIRIQHITISQGPILRKLGLSNVIIHTASGMFQIQGLLTEEANNISEALKSKLYTRLEEQDKV